MLFNNNQLQMTIWFPMGHMSSCWKEGTVNVAEYLLRFFEKAPVYKFIMYFTSYSYSQRMVNG